MPEILKNLSPQALFTVIIVTLILVSIAVVIIALRGKLGIKIGNKSLSLGGGGDEKTKKNTKAVPNLPPTVTIPQKRSCGDCILLLMGEREKFELKMRKETNKIMKTQMTFAEQKLIEIQTKVSNNISGLIHQSIEEKSSTVEESVQYKLVYGLLKDSLLNIKDEIRRSFKENGFYDINGSEFSWYVKERTQVISSMLTQYMRNIYPDRGGVLQLHKILKCMEKEATFLAGIVNDIYSYAREVRLECDEKVKELQIQFGAWVDNFIK
jgi:hypothetical protein